MAVPPVTNTESMQAPQQLPLFYKSLVPLSSQLHPNHGLAVRDNLAYTRVTHAIPVTVDEFPIAQRHYPIVFGLGENPAPLALIGLQEGDNLFVGEDGQWQAGAYIPAFVRRYPFMLARINQGTEELSLCFDDTSGLVTADAEDKLFAGTEPTDTTKNILTFCEQFEQAIMRTRSFMEELAKLDLLIDGEVTIQQPGMPEPAKYSGFQMIAEDKLQNLRGDQTRQMVKSGLMGLVYAHLFSLSQIAGLFEKQMAARAANA